MKILVKLPPQKHDIYFVLDWGESGPWTKHQLDYSVHEHHCPTPNITRCIEETIAMEEPCPAYKNGYWTDDRHYLFEAVTNPKEVPLQVLGLLERLDHQIEYGIDE